MTTNRTKSVTAFEEVYINRPPTHPTPTTKTMSTPTNSGSTKAKSAQKKFGDRFAVDCALLQERTKGIKKADQKKKKKITSGDLKIDKTNKNNNETKATKMEMKMKEEDAEQEDSQHHIRILKATIERLKEQNLFDTIKISTLVDQVKEMEESKIEKEKGSFPRIRIARIHDNDLDEFRMPPHIFTEMPKKWQRFVKAEIALDKRFENTNSYDMGEHFEMMMNEHEDEDVSEEDVEKAKEVLDKMWDYGEEDENGEVDYLYRENNWIDGFDWTLVVGWKD